MNKLYKCQALVSDIINNDEPVYTKLKQLSALFPDIAGPGSVAAKDEIERFASLTIHHPKVSPVAFAYLQRCLVHPMEYETGYTTNAKPCSDPNVRRHRNYQLAYAIRRDRTGCYDHERNTPSTVDRQERFVKDRYAELKAWPTQWYFRGGVFAERLHDDWSMALESNSRANQWRRTHKQIVALNTAIAKTDLLLAEYRCSEAAQFGLPPVYFQRKLSLREFQRTISLRLRETQNHGKNHNYHLAYRYYTRYRDILITADATQFEVENSNTTDTVRSVTFHRKGCSPVTYTTEYWIESDAMPRILADVDAVITAREQRWNTTVSEKNDVLSKLAHLRAMTWVGLHEVKRNVMATTEHSKVDVWRIVERNLSSAMTGFRGNWVLKLLDDAIGLDRVTVSSDLKDVQLLPYFTVTLEKKIISFEFYRREFDGEIYDYCIKRTSDGMTFHAATYSECIAGLREKTAGELERQKKTPLTGALRGVITAQRIIKRFRFCRAGIAAFCTLNNLDMDGAYRKKQLRAVIDANRAENIARFGRELDKVGLL